MRPHRIRVHSIRAIDDLDIHLRPFTALVAPNNAGKSTILDAIRLFYGDLAWEPSRDAPWGREHEDSWVEVEFELTDEEAEELTTHADGSALVVRRRLTGEGAGFTAIIRDESPIAWHSPAIGRCVYVPADARLEDYIS